MNNFLIESPLVLLGFKKLLFHHIQPSETNRESNHIPGPCRCPYRPLLCLCLSQEGLEVGGGLRPLC